jgi:predicted glycogen debranching enzyme
MLEVGKEPVRTVVAGYHWFTDWGRDTMISLEGLTLCTGRYEQARAILKTFSHYISKGLIPNHFPEGRRTAIYNTADATLWYFHALDRYCEITRDTGLIRELFPILKSIIKHHFEGTDFGIGMDPSDGLLRASADGLALSWMDAKVDGWVVTPRRGKPVEIQALWYNALRLMRMWAHNLNEQDEVYERAAEQVFDSFNDRYWNESAAALYDVIDGPEGNDGSLRPNQLFAISLHFPVLKQEKWKTVLNTTTEQLLTPVGLRTLSAQDPQYKSRYEGNRMSRDAAYHQGLVWPWLMGALFDAVQKIDSNLDRIESILNQYQQQTREKCVGTVPEVYDAEPPYRPGGCIAQAWSVAEVLRILLTLKRDRIRFPARTIAVEHRIS